MVSQKIPIWQLEPIPAKIQCTLVTKGLHKDEYSVQFIGDGESFTAFVPSAYVDVANKRIMVSVVAEFDDNYLIDLPVDTLTSGPRIRLPKTSKVLILQR
mgnify:CR=1 FL=1